MKATRFVLAIALLLAISFAAGSTTPIERAQAVAIDDFSVNVTFNEGPAQSVYVTASCDLSLYGDYEVATPPFGAAFFGISDPDWGDGVTSATCSAYIESFDMPTGYSLDEDDSNCDSFSVTYNNGDSCTIALQLNKASFFVSKDWASGPDELVTVNVSCDDTSVQVNASDITINEASGAWEFELSYVPSDGTYCYATEDAVDGATADLNDSANTCDDGQYVDGTTTQISCTIYNVWNEATVRVNVDFEPGSSGPSFDLVLSCDDGTIDTDTLSATADGAEDFSVFGIAEGGTNCSVSYTPPSGYVTASDTCSAAFTTAEVDDGSTPAAECSISVVTAATITVQKDYEPDNAPNPGVTITLTCTGATIEANDLTASEGSPAVFAVTNFETGATCSAAESNTPEGWFEVTNTCTTANLVLTAGGSNPAACTITNSPPPDSDGDGVVDNLDVCPGTLNGLAVLSNGCSIGQSTPTQCAGITFARVIVGSDEGETLTGTSGSDLIIALAGADIINGLGGNDCIIGGPGADVIDGGAGNDLIFGGDDGDTINGGAGNDTMYGEAGTDSLNGGNDNDHLYGGADADNLNGGNGNDRLYGGADNDVLNGAGGNDQLTGEGGIDQVNGGTGTDGCSAIDAGGTRSLCEGSFTGF